MVATGGAGGGTPLPMFPLETVLLPDAGLRLRVFEPRYRAMLRQCLAADRRFGVVLIARGSEVGGGDERHGVGTLAEVGEAVVGPDGQGQVAVVGIERLVVRRWLTEEPFPRAAVEVWPDPPEEAAAVPGDRLHAVDRRARRVRALAAELGAPVAVTGPPVAGVAAGRAAYRIAASVPLGPHDRQRCLEAPDAARRLEVLDAMLTDLEAALAHRLSPG